MSFEGSPSKISLRLGQHAEKTLSTLWCLMDERKSVEDTNAALDKRMVSDSSIQDGARTPISLTHATWQDGHDDILLSAPLRHQPRRVQPL